jgi:large repetitive protein
MDPTLSLTGVEAALGTQVEYSLDNGATWTMAPPTAAEGPNTVQVRQTDVAGNASAATELGFTLDTTAPAAPGVALKNDTGGSNTDGITSDPTLALSGVEAASGTLVEYSLDNGATWSPTAPGAADLFQGPNTVQVRQTDVAGNPSAAGSLTFTLYTAPAVGAPSITDATAAGTWTVSGTADPNAAVTLYDGASQIATATADSTGNWLSVGAISTTNVQNVTATATDAAGNVGPPSGRWHLGTSGADTIAGDTSAETFVGNGGADNLTGAGGDDRFQFLSSQLAAAKVNGGAGTDTIQVMDAATLTDAAFLNVRAVERLQLGNFASQSLTLGANAKLAANSTSGLTVDGSADIQALTVDASAAAFAGAHLIITGGSGDDTFVLNRARLALHDSIVGGVGNDTVTLNETAAAVVQDTDLAGLSGIEALTFKGAFANSITLGGYAATLLTSAAGNTLAINAGTSSTLTVDASLLGATGHVNLTGGAGADMFLMNAARFNAGDAVAAGTGADTVQIADTGPVVITDAAFSKVSGVEKLVLGATGADLTLGANATTAIASATGATLTIDDSAGNGDFKVDASGVGATANLVMMAGADTTNTLTGGAGNDTLKVSSTHFLDPSHPDSFTGGLGTDTLVFTDGPASFVMKDADFSGLHGVETVTLGSGTGTTATNITLGSIASAQLDPGARLTIDTSVISFSYAAKIEVHASAMTANMTLIANDGNTFGQPSQYPVTIEAGSGASDTLYLKGGNAPADSWFTGWKGLEVLRLENAGSMSATLGANALAMIQTNGTTQTFTVDYAQNASSYISVDASALDTTAGGFQAGVHLNFYGGGHFNGDTLTISTARLNLGDVVNFGAGQTDGLVLKDGGTIGDGAFAQVTGIDQITLAGATSWVVGSNAAAAMAGAYNSTFTVAGSSTTALAFDGSAVGASTKLAVTGGAGADAITGGAGADALNGMVGADVLTGGGGADSFTFIYYQQNSLVGAFDTVTDFTSGADKMKIGHTISSLKDLAMVGTGSLQVDLTTLLAGANAGNLAANQATRVTLTGAGDAGTYLVIDNGTGGYSATADNVVKLSNDSLLAVGDFTA